jgi:peptide/nickel transport system substrate-binding protein
MSARSRSFAASILACLVLLTGCVAQTTGDATASGSAGPIDPRRLILNIGVATEANSFDPQVNTAQISAQRFYRNIYETLVTWSADNQLKPMLADSWTVSSDGLSYRFKLHPGVKFSDGTPFDSAAVKAAFDRFKTLGKGAVLLFDSIDRITPVDATTVDFVLKFPYSPFLTVLASWQAAIFVSPTAAKANEVNGDWGQAWLMNHTAGTGPFMLDSWVPSSKLVLVRNPQSRETLTADSIQRMVYTNISEPSALRQQLENGDIDIADVVPPALIDPLKRATGVTVTLDDAPGAGFGWWIAFNQAKKPFSDTSFRQAISYAIDYKRLVSLWNGIAQQSQGPYPQSFTPWFSAADSLQYNQDLAKATDLMKKAGYSVPINPPMKISLTWQNGFGVQRDMGTLIKEDLLKLGIELDIQANDIPVWRTNIWNHTYDMTFFQESHRYADPDAFVSFQLASQEWRVGGTNPGVRDPHIDDLIKQGKTTNDPAKRKTIYNELQRLATEGAPYLYLVNSKSAWAAGNDVKGIVWVSSYGPYWNGHAIKKAASRK